MTKSCTLRKPVADGAIAFQEKGRFATNLTANVANFGLSVLVGLWLTPYLIRHLGISAYGLVPLATTVASYVGLFSVALNAVVGRFITIALDRQDYAEANRIFNTSFWGAVVLVLILLWPALWLSSRARFFFNIPAGYEGQFGLLFLCTIGVFFLATLTGPFGVATFWRNRFDLSNVVNIAGTCVRVAAIVFLFNLSVPTVWHIGLAMLVSSLAALALSIMVWRSLAPMLFVQWSAFSLRTFTRMTGMGGWMIINYMGSTLFLSIDLVVVNKIAGAEAGGRYGAVMLWSVMLRSLAYAIAGVFGPTIVSLYGRHDTSGLIAYSRRAVKFLGIIIALSIGLICGFAEPLLQLWLGPAFRGLAPLMILMNIHLCVNLAVLPLQNIQVAANSVRLPGILNVIMGLGNVGLSLLLAGPVGWGMYGVAAAGAIMLTARNIIFTPLYAAHILGLPYRAFYREIWPVVGTAVSLTGAGFMLAQNLRICGWFGLGLSGLGLAGAFTIFAYRLFLTNEERRHIVSLVFPRSTVPM